MEGKNLGGRPPKTPETTKSGRVLVSMEPDLYDTVLKASDGIPREMPETIRIALREHFGLAAPPDTKCKLTPEEQALFEGTTAEEQKKQQREEESRRLMDKMLEAEKNPYHIPTSPPATRERPNMQRDFFNR